MNRGSQKLWAFLLVLDSILVVVFGGAVAANVSKHWGAAEAPAPATEPARHRRTSSKAAVKPAEAVKTAQVPAKKPAAPVAAVKPTAPDASPKKAALPGLSASSRGPMVSRRGRAKARKVTFSLSAPGARSVKVVGAFIVRGGRANMTRRGNVWTAALYLNPGRYRYFYSVDDMKMLDPGASATDRGASLLIVR